jgi:hypothetical protein
MERPIPRLPPVIRTCFGVGAIPGEEGVVVVELEEAQSTVVVCSVDGGESGRKCRVRVDDASLRLAPGIRGMHNRCDIL